MACVNASGEISESAHRILAAMQDSTPLAQVAVETGLPLYRIRSAMRELGEAGLAVETETGWKTTEAGRKAMEGALAEA